MPIQKDGNAPYAPAATVTDVIERYRDHGLATPFDADLLERAGVPPSLSARTLQALKLLDLLDADGQPSAQMQDLARASSEEYKERFAEIVRAAYADVLAFTDPAQDPPERVEDAFRSYTPRGQRPRMVTLFLGLCQYAGIVDEIPKRRPGPKPGPKPRASAPRASSEALPRAEMRRVRARPAKPSVAQSQSYPENRLPDAIAALLSELPGQGQSWTAIQRGSFIGAFSALLDVYYPISDSHPGRALPSGQVQH